MPPDRIASSSSPPHPSIVYRDDDDDDDDGYHYKFLYRERGGHKYIDVTPLLTNSWSVLRWEDLSSRNLTRRLLFSPFPPRFFRRSVRNNPQSFIQ